MSPTAGRFVTFEGVEGSGKSTQMERLARRLAAAGVETLQTREPGGTALGRLLRAALLQAGTDPISPRAELLLYAADRAQHVAEVLRPALARGVLVLCDRYLDATVAYQGYGRGLGAAAVMALHRDPPLDLRPDLTVLLDLDPEVGLERARSRNRTLSLDRSEGRFEEEALDFHRRVRQGYLELAAAEPARFRLVFAGGSPDEVEARITDALSELVPALRRGAGP